MKNRISALRRGPVLALALMGLLPACLPRPATAGSYDNQPKILLHLTAPTHADACNNGRLAGCEWATTHGSLTAPNVGPYYYAYLLVEKGNLPSVGGVQLGINYHNDVTGIINGNPNATIVFGWNPCATLQFSMPPPNNWPEPGSGVIITWDTQVACQTDTVPAVAGYFYLAAYAPDTLQITPRPVDSRAAVYNCQAQSFTLAPSDLGSIVFSAGGLNDGYNPCCPSGCPQGTPPPPPPPPPPPEPAILLLHIGPAVTGNACTAGALSDPANAVVQADLSTPSGPFYFVYLLAAPGTIAGIAGLQCGISYQNNQPGDMSDGTGIDVFDWHLCADAQFPMQGAAGWPHPGSGNIITWERTQNCQTGPTAVAGYFYVGAYTPDMMRIVPHPQAGQPRVIDCDVAEAETIVDDSGIGFVAFSENASVHGCNPAVTSCAEPVPVQRTTWGAIKAGYR